MCLGFYRLTLATYFMQSLLLLWPEHSLETCWVDFIISCYVFCKFVAIETWWTNSQPPNLDDDKFSYHVLHIVSSCLVEYFYYCMLMESTCVDVGFPLSRISILIFSVEKFHGLASTLFEWSFGLYLLLIWISWAYSLR